MNKTEVKITVNGLWETEDKKEVNATKSIPHVFGTEGEMETKELEEIFREVFGGAGRIANRERNFTFRTTAEGMEQFNRALEDQIKIQIQELAGMRPQLVVLEEPLTVNPITKIPDKYERLPDETDLQYLDRISEE